MITAGDDGLALFHQCKSPTPLLAAASETACAIDGIENPTPPARQPLRIVRSFLRQPAIIVAVPC